MGVDQELPAKDCGDNNASGGGCASLATGTAEREEALARIDARRGKRRITLGADKAYDMAGFVALLRSRSVSETPGYDLVGPGAKILFTDEECLGRGDGEHLFRDMVNGFR